MAVTLDAVAAERRDRFGNLIDPTVGYARGPVLDSPAAEVRKLRHGRRLVRERIERYGPEGIFDLTGLPRAFPLHAEDLPRLESQLSFYAYFDGQVEPLALEFVKAHPAMYEALVLNRVSAAALAVAFALLSPGDLVLSLSPFQGSRSHPSVQRAVERMGARFAEAVGLEALRALMDHHPQARLLVLTPITADKRHLPPEDYRRAVALAHERGLLTFVDDAHMSARCAFFDDPTGFEQAQPDLLAFSVDKHIVGPRSGVLIGRKDLMQRISTVALEFGLEAQSGHYVAVLRALQEHDPEAVRQAGALVHELLPRVQAAYGAERAYLAGPGVAIGGEDALAVAMAMAGTTTSCLAPVEAASLVSLRMLERHGLATVAAVSMPGSAPTVRIMMFRHGPRAGVERILAALEDGLQALASVLHEPDAARPLLLGEA